MSSARTLSDRYVLEAAVGTGSMGTVFRARDSSTGEVVAIKCLKSMDAADILRFDREFAIVSQLRHPAIVSCWGAAKTESGEAYFVMEWLEGESLRERLRRSELTLHETLAVTMRVLAGLAHAHASDVVHRDVKPANIFLEGGLASRAKLLDFGIARRASEGETLTAMGQFVGTPGYVSPEQIRGQRVDQRADVYSIGCLLFRCLTGRAVFDEDNVLEMLVRVTRDRAPRLDELRADLPGPLCDLVNRMLEREPIDRPADAAEVLRELEVLQQTIGDEAGSKTGPTSPTRPREASERGAEADEKGASLSGPTSMNASSEVIARKGLSTRTKVAAALVLLAAAAVPAAYYASSPSAADDAPPPGQPTAPPSAVDSYGPPEERVGKDARSAWGSIRMGARHGALRRLNERASSGSASASERLWLALLSSPGDPARKSYREAVTRAGELTPFERAVTDAVAPLFAVPSDFAATDKAIAELSRAASSPELLLVLARLRTQMNDREGAYTALAGASTGQWSVASRLERSYVDREFFDFDSGRKDALSCLEQRPDAVDCVAFLARQSALDGDCKAMETYARTWVGIDPDDPRGHEMLAFSMAAGGEADGALLEALEQKWERLGERERAAAALKDRVLLHALRGRFGDASSLTRDAVNALPVGAPLLQRLETSFSAMLVATETGDEKMVSEFSVRVLERASAATPTNPTDAAYFLLFANVAGAFGSPDSRWKELGAKAFERYESYLAEQGDNLRPYERLMPWIVGYAAGAHGDERVKDAYEALDRYGPLPPPGRADDVDLVIGTVLYRSGELPRALPYLRRSARSCLMLENPYAVQRARQNLGRALELDHDLEGARLAYESVLAAWPDAKPRSETVVAAREGLERIRRGSKPPR